MKAHLMPLMSDTEKQLRENCFILVAEAFYDTNYIASKGGEV